MIPETISKHLQSQIILLITLRGYFPFLDFFSQVYSKGDQYPGFSTVSLYIEILKKICVCICVYIYIYVCVYIKQSSETV